MMLSKITGAGLCAFILMSFLVGCGGGDSSVAVRDSVSATDSVQSSSSGQVAGEYSRILGMINAERKRCGVAPLEARGDLNRLALKHSEYQASAGKMTHVDGGGREVDGRLDREKISWMACGENVGRNKGFDDFESKAVESWMSSPPHRKNILNRQYKYTGVGFAKGGDGYYYFTQVFLSE
ncbi:MAG: CAP domain-containing protein [Planctomycetes bacterium]|nr:CAP domain-containing protein [Planctomycetota bacterium]